MAFSKNRIFFNKPTAFNYTRNCVLSLFLLGPFYRLYFWISVPTVTVNIVKRFSTQKYSNSQAEAGVFPFINNVLEFVIEQAPTGHGSDNSSPKGMLFLSFGLPIILSLCSLLFFIFIFMHLYFCALLCSICLLLCPLL